MHFTRRLVPANAGERRPVIASAPGRLTCFGSSSNDTRTSALAAQRLAATCEPHAALRGERGWLASRPWLHPRLRLRHRSSYCCSNCYCKSRSTNSNDEPDARRAVPHGGNGSSSTNSNRCSSSSRSNQPFGSPWPAPNPGAKSRSRPRTTSDHRLVHDSSLAPPFPKGNSVILTLRRSISASNVVLRTVLISRANAASGSIHRSGRADSRSPMIGCRVTQRGSHAWRPGIAIDTARETKKSKSDGEANGAPSLLRFSLSATRDVENLCGAHLRDFETNAKLIAVRRGLSTKNSLLAR